MDCKKIELILNDYLENMLDPGIRKSIDEHCKACKDCSSLIADCRRNIILLKQLQWREVPSDLDKRVYEAIDKYDKKTFSWDMFKFPALRIALPVFAALLIVLGIYYRRIPTNVVVKPAQDNPVIGIVKDIPKQQSQPQTQPQNPTSQTDPMIIVAKEMKDIENTIYSFTDQNNSYFLGAGTPKINNELKEKLNSQLNSTNLNNLKVTDNIKQILYRRAKRLHNINLLRQRNIITQNNKAMLAILKPDYGLSKADIIMIDEENADRKLLISFYTKTLESNENFKSIPPQELTPKIEKTLSDILNSLF